MMKRDWSQTIVILILTFLVFFLVDYNWQKSEELFEKQKKIDEMEIQINSLWDNVQQIQDEYGKIVDKLYVPERIQHVQA